MKSRIFNLSLRIAFVILLLSILTLQQPNEVFAQEESEGSAVKEFSIYTGWNKGSLKHEADDYEVVPLSIRIGFDANPFFDGMNIDLPGDFLFMLEPFFGYVNSPESNEEYGLAFALKYNQPVTERFYVYAEGGVGFLHSTQDMRLQTHNNFQEHYELGVAFRFDGNKAFNFAYQARHFSNGGLDEPNAGVDTDAVLCGITIFY